MSITGRAAAFLMLSAITIACRSASAGGERDGGLAGFTPLSVSDLQKLKGGEEPVTLNLTSSAATNNSTVSGNSIGNVGGTGEISSSALSGNSGLTTLIANSGNQVTISQSTIVNVFLH